MTPAFDLDAIHALLAAWQAATARRDIPALLELVTDDIVFLPPVGDPIAGRDAMARLYTAFFGQYREIAQSPRIREIQISGDWAILWGDDEMYLTAEGNNSKIHLMGKGLSIARRQSDGTWKFWRGINNMVTQPAI